MANLFSGFEHQTTAEALASDVAELRLQESPTRAEEPPLQWMFSQGNVLVLKSTASEKCLRVIDGEVDGRGTWDTHSQFRVHSRSSGVIALQSMHNSDWWLAIYDGTVNGKGQGGPYCQFKLKETSTFSNFESVSLESHMYPDQYLGIRPDGSINPPTEVNSEYCQFTPILQSSGPPPKNPPSTTPSLAPPMAPPSYAEAMSYPLQATGQQSHQPQPGYPPQPTSAYPGVPVSYPYPQASSASAQTRYSYPQAVGQSQYPPAGRPPLRHQTTFPPPAGSYPAYQPQPEYYRAPQPQVQVPMHVALQRQVSAPVVQMATGPSSPIGYSVLDLLRGGNTIRLIPRNSFQTRPIKLDGSAIRPGGSYTLTDSELVVVCPSPGIVILRSASKPNHHIGVTNQKGAVKGNIKDIGDQACHFRLHVRPDFYVCFESMKFPGVFFNLSKKKSTGVEDWDVQFRVRAEAILNSLSTPLMTPYGRPSVANNLPDRTIIQLYSKSTQTYLCVKKSGAVKESGDDKLTYLLYRDRGMGIVSLDAYQRPGFRLRMFNYMLQGKGEPGLSADFYFKENSDGSVSFESVLCLGGFVCIPSAAPQSNLFIYKILIQKHQGYDTVSKIPVN